MYMSGIEEHPLWANSLSQEIIQRAIQGDSYTPRVIFYLPKKGKRNNEVTGGHARCEQFLIELMVDTLEPTEYKRFIIVHETAHLIDVHRNGRQYLKGGRNNFHPQSFWDIAIPLYQEYKLLGVAIEHEYMKGRKLIKEYILDNS